MSAQLIRSHIDRILLYLQPSLQLANCHMVEFITAGLWEKFVPSEIRGEVTNVDDIEAATKLFLGNGDENKYPNVHKLIAESKKHCLEHLEGILLSTSQLLDALGVPAESTKNACNIKEFMNEKKNHEVDVFSRVVSTLTSKLSDSTQCDTYVLDAGDGKGYLSSRLALQYRMKVLGIDASKTNTDGSQKRLRKLQRAWPGLEERTRIIETGLTPPRRSNKAWKKQKTYVAETDNETYKSVNCYITNETDFNGLVEEHFGVKSEFVACLSGLHTCGNLACTCLEAFTKNQSIRLLCNVGCCYHLLTEMSGTDECAESSGFPMSNYLKDRHIRLGRNARMLASQSMHRTESKSALNTQSLYFRALLEVIVQEKLPTCVETPRVGKVKKYANFAEYLLRCEEKCGLGLDKLESSYVDEVASNYAKMEKLISLFYLIRMSYAQVVEALILLDRLLYVKENHIERSFLVRLFDPVISPRCFAVVAVKQPQHS